MVFDGFEGGDKGRVFGLVVGAGAEVFFDLPRPAALLHYQNTYPGFPRIAPGGAVDIYIEAVLIGFIKGQAILF